MGILHKLFYPVLFLFAIGIFFLHYAGIGQAVYGDGIGYYAHLHSWWIDHDWDYTNEYRHIYTPENNNAYAPQQNESVQIVAITPAGKAENFYSPGVAVVLTPFYLVGDFFTVISPLWGGNLPRNGYAHVYQVCSGIGAVFYAVLGLFFLEKIILSFLKDTFISKLSIITLFLSTNLFYYGSFDVINSHFASFFLTTLFFYLLLVRKLQGSQQFWLGLVAGIATTVRLQDGAVVIIWAVASFIEWKELRSSKSFMPLIKQAVYFFLGLSVGILPMLIHWLIMFGNPFKHTYLRNFYLDMNDDRALDYFGSFFHRTNGLFFRTPLLLLLFLFFIRKLIQKQSKKYFLFFLFFSIQVVIITLQGGWPAAAYGGRMYISSLVFFGVLLADLLFILKKRSLVGMFTICLLFIVINFFSMTSFVLIEKEAGTNKRGLQPATFEKLFKIVQRFVF